MNEGNSAISFLFGRIKSNVDSTANFWSTGNGPVELHKSSDDFPISHPGLIFKYCLWNQPGWKAPSPHDVSAQGKPKDWSAKHHGQLSQHSYYVMTATGVAPKWDSVPDIFTHANQSTLPGHAGMDMMSRGNGKGTDHRFYWNFYAWMAARPTIHGYTILDLIKMPRRWMKYTESGNPTELLKAALATRAGLFAAKGGFHTTLKTDGIPTTHCQCTENTFGRP